MRVCEICGEEFSNSRVFSNHVRWKHKEATRPKVNCKYCSAEFLSNSIIRHEKNCIKNPLVFNKKNKFCRNCNMPFADLYKSFCSSSCSATYNNAHIDRKKMPEESKRKLSIKMSEILKQRWTDGIYDNLFFKSKRFSSKTERSIVDFFKKTFPNDEWKAGGRIKIGEGKYLSRDLYSDKLKVCFEYDGIWHFKDIHSQLDKKQTKDRLLYDWCLKNNYRLIRVDEDSFVDLKQIEDLVYKRDEQLILVGERYNYLQVHQGGMTEW